MSALQMFLFLPMVLAAQNAPSEAVVRGTLLERDSQTAAGEFSVRVADHQVFRYRFDTKTQVERDQQTIDVARLQPGDNVEVVCDAGQQAPLRYARAIHVLSAPHPPRPVSRARPRVYRDPIDRLNSSSTLAVSGVVFRLNADRMILHTRVQGDQTVILRQDTRYVQDGDAVQANDLKPNTRVFVRVGRTLYNELEAYQVVWGQILMPR